MCPDLVRRLPPRRRDLRHCVGDSRGFHRVLRGRGKFYKAARRNALGVPPKRALSLLPSVCCVLCAMRVWFEEGGFTFIRLLLWDILTRHSLFPGFLCLCFSPFTAAELLGSKHPTMDRRPRRQISVGQGRDRPPARGQLELQLDRQPAGFAGLHRRRHQLGQNRDLRRCLQGRLAHADSNLHDRLHLGDPPGILRWHDGLRSQRARR